jgi:hypothetical protein
MIGPVGYIDAVAASMSFEFPSILIKKNLPLKNKNKIRKNFRLSSVSDDWDTYGTVNFPSSCDSLINARCVMRAT